MDRSRCSATVADAIGPVAGDQDNVVGIATARGDVAAREFAGAPRQSSVVAGPPADSVLHAAAVPVATVVAARRPDCDSSHLDPARLGFDRHPVDDPSLAVAAPSAAVVLDSGVADQLNAVVALATAVGRVAAAVPNAAVDLDSAAVALVPVGCVVRLAAGPVQIDVLPVDSVVPVAVVPLRPGSAGFARHLVRVFPGPQRDQMRPAVRRINWLTLQAV